MRLRSGTADFPPGAARLTAARGLPAVAPDATRRSPCAENTAPAGPRKRATTQSIRRCVRAGPRPGADPCRLRP
ncbi:protein of unknown function [Rhodovastum atsumiense]|nr:protein of unknown function [Rhodovastum atsumiense]